VSNISVLTDFVKENDREISEPVCDGKFVAFLGVVHALA
jgi:hypothetical protein